MTILQREHSPDGILIHLEDWSCEYKAAKNATIALYPVAQVKHLSCFGCPGSNFHGMLR